MGWWEYLQRQMKRRKMSQADIARGLGVQSSTVSRWQHQAPTPDTLRRLSKVLEVPVLELFVQAGHLTREEAGVREIAAEVDLADDVPSAIDADPDLLPEAKEHLRNQYELLLRVMSDQPDRQASSEGPGLRSVARKRGSGGDEHRR